MTSAGKEELPNEPQQPSLAAYEALKNVLEKEDTEVSVDLINRMVLREELVRLIKNTTDLENRLDDLQDETRRERRSLFLKLLPIMDSLDRMIRQTNPENELAASLESLRSQFLSILEEQDVVPIPVEIGQQLDLNVAEISRQQRRSDLEPDMIIQVDRRGYIFQSKVLRKARVVISTKP